VGGGGGGGGTRPFRNQSEPHKENNLVFYSNIVKVTVVLVYPFISGEM
jgi:hypothetical protein